MFAQVDYVDLLQVNEWVHAPIDVRRAQGALRAWIRVDATEVVGATADLALKDVDARLAQDLPPLQLSSFQGRVTQKRWGDEARGGQQFGLADVTFVLASGAQFPPLDLTYRSTPLGHRPAASSSMARASICRAWRRSRPICRSAANCSMRLRAMRRPVGCRISRCTGTATSRRWATLAAKARFEELSSRRATGANWRARRHVDARL